MKNIIVLVSLFSILSSAKAEEITAKISDIKGDNHFLLDGAPLLIGGLGATYERVLGANWTLGPSVTYFQLKSDDKEKSSSGNDVAVKSKVMMLGIRGRYFFSGANSQGAYLMTGLNKIDITTEAQLGGTKAGEASSTSTGGMAGAGYQLLGNTIGDNQLIVNVSGMLANGYAVGTRAYTINGGPTKVDAPEAQSSIFLEAGVGMIF